jgi:L-rhamnose mutarotase
VRAISSPHTDARAARPALPQVSIKDSYRGTATTRVARQGVDFCVMPKYALCAELQEGCRDRYIEMHHHATVAGRLKDINRRAGVTKEQIFLFGNTIFLYGECDDVARMNAVLAADGLAAAWSEECDNTLMKARSEVATDKFAPLLHVCEWLLYLVHFSSTATPEAVLLLLLLLLLITASTCWWLVAGWSVGLLAAASTMIRPCISAVHLKH